MTLDGETTKAALKITDEALELYSKVLDSIVPWKAFNKTLVELDKYTDYYSQQSALLIGDIKVLMKNGIDAYYRATQLITGWCDTAIPLLTTYVDLFNDHTVEKANAQKYLLVQVLSNGITQMTAAQASVATSASSFNGAIGRLTTLNSRFQVEFGEKSAYFLSKVSKIRLATYLGSAFIGVIGLGIGAALIEFKYIPELKRQMGETQKFYDNLSEKVEQAFHDVDVTRGMLQKESQQIGDLKVKTEKTKTFIDLEYIPELRDTIIRSAQSLIRHCNEYRRKHARDRSW